MSAREIQAGKAFFLVEVKDRLQAGLKAAAAKLRAFGAVAAGMGAALMGASSAIAAPLAAAVNQFIGVGDQLDKMAARTGISVEALSQLKYAAGASGTSLETLEGSVRKMQKGVDDLQSGNQTAIANFGRLGLTMADLAGQSPDKQFEIVADRIAAIEDPAQRAAAAMDIFGKSGAELLPLMAGGAAGIQDLRRQAEQLGLTLSTEDASAAAKLGDTLDALRQVISGMITQIGAALAPVVTEVAGRILAVAVSVGRWIRENRELAVTAAKVAAVIGAVGAGLVALGAAGAMGAMVLTGLASIGGMIATIFGGVVAVLGAIVSPLGLLVAGVAAAAVWFFRFTEAGRSMVSVVGTQLAALFAFVKDVFGGIVDAIMSGDLALAGRIAMLGLEVAWRTGLGTLQNVLRSALGSMGDALVAGEFALAAKILWQNLQLWWLQGTAGISQAWHETMTGMASIFDTILTTIRKAWNDAVTFIAGIVVRLAGMIDRLTGGKLNIDVDGTLATLKDDQTRYSQGLDAAKQSRDEARGAALTQKLADTEKAIAELEAARAAAAAAAKSGADATQGEAAAKLEQTMQELRDSIARAREQRGESDLTGILDSLTGQLQSAQEQTTELGGQSVGTFSGAAAALMTGGANKAIEETAEATRETAEHTREMSRRIRTAEPLVFTAGGA